ncbi:unnamed protein product, partial [Iphiclides podalirius]
MDSFELTFAGFGAKIQSLRTADMIREFQLQKHELARTQELQLLYQSAVSSGKMVPENREQERAASVGVSVCH